MAIFRPGPLVDAISGAVGGAEFSLNRGHVAKKRQLKKAKTDPGLDRAQAIYQRAVHSWATLTDEQRLAWRQLANVTPRRNRVGLPRYLTGFQLYVQNSIIAFYTQASFAAGTPNAPQAQPATKIEFTSSTSSSVDLSITTGAGSYAFAFCQVAAAWFLGRPHRIHPRSWRLVFSGRTDLSGIAQLWPPNLVPSTQQNTFWPDDFPPPTTGWTLLVRFRTLDPNFNPSGWLTLSTEIT